MKLRTLLKLQKLAEEREIPSDILEFDSVHHSQSKDMSTDILDLHLTHAIRILNYYLTDNVYPRHSNRKEINDHLDVIKDNLDDIKEYYCK